MKMNKKALSAAITLSLVLGVYGVAGADSYPNLYGATSGAQAFNGNYQKVEPTDTSAVVIAADGKYVSIDSNMTNSGANYTVTGGTWGYAYGGYKGAVSSNTVTISGGTINYSVYGGSSYYGTSGAAENNTVTISGGTIKSSVYGGWANNDDASSNTVTISGSAAIGAKVHGGYVNSSGSGAAKNNTVTISGGTIKSSVYGGYSSFASGGASNNTVTISDSASVTGNVYGGFASQNADAASSGNTVMISDSASVTGDVYGGSCVVSKTASNNTVTITGGTINGSVYGGSSGSLAENNTINLGGYEDSGEIKTATTWKATINGNVYINYAKGSSSGGTLNVYNVGNTINANVSEYLDGDLHADKANVNFYIPKTAVTDTTMVKVEGTADLSNATINTSTKNYNGDTITLISAETLNTDSVTYQIDGTAATSKEIATNITGMTNVAMSVGYDTTVANKLSFGSTGYKLTGDSDITEAVTLNKSLDASSHAMNLYNTMSVPSLTNVGDLNFYIPSTAINGYTMLTVTGEEQVDLANSNVKAGVQTGSKLAGGDKINLIATTAGVTAPKSTGMVATAGYTDYKLDIAVESTNLVATVAKGEDNKPITKPSENAKSPLETMAAGLSMLNLGGDMLAGEGMDSAVHAAKFGEASGDIFAAVGGNKSKIKTGSHVDLKGVTMNLGFVKEIANKSGSLFIGPVVEYGHGTYDSYLDNGYHGEGNSKYWGLGVLAKQLNNSGMYYEGSLRGGKVENDYSAAQGGYDTDAKYIAAHLGLGKIVKLNDKNNIDVYAKYFLTHQSGSDAVNATNNFDFSCATSNRTRLGARYNHSFTEKNSIYGGLAWQYEFSGETKGTIDGNSVEAPTIKGHTGILELGWKANPTKNFDISIGMNGYTGVERGVGANLKLNWKF